jgi:hypothetical protein
MSMTLNDEIVWLRKEYASERARADALHNERGALRHRLSEASNQWLRMHELFCFAVLSAPDGTITIDDEVLIAKPVVEIREERDEMRRQRVYSAKIKRGER